MFEALSTIGSAALSSATDLGTVLLQEGTQSSPAITQKGAAAIGIGLAAIGAGYAERGIGSSAIGALAEDSLSIGIAVFLTVLPETLVIFALVALFV
jgi:V/A-type H+-transporting ATPase subunit K